MTTYFKNGKPVNVGSYSHTNLPSESPWGKQAKQMQVQTRNEEGSLNYFNSLADALKHAREDQTVWKISFSLPTDERCRLVKDTDGRFYYEDVFGNTQ